MKIELAVIGKTSIGYLKQGIDEYIKRLKHYVPFEIKYIDDIKTPKTFQRTNKSELKGQKFSRCSTNQILWCCLMSTVKNTHRCNIQVTFKSECWAEPKRWCLWLEDHTDFHKRCTTEQTIKFLSQKWHSITKWFAWFSRSNYIAPTPSSTTSHITTNKV